MLQIRTSRCPQHQPVCEEHVAQEMTYVWYSINFCWMDFHILKTLPFGLQYRKYGLPWWPSSKESACKAGDARDRGPIPGSGRSPRGNINLLRYFWLESPMDRGACWATVQKVVKSWTQVTTHRQVKLKANITASDEDWKYFLWD